MSESEKLGIEENQKLFNLGEASSAMLIPSNQKLETLNLKLETLQTLQTRNLKPETRNQKPFQLSNDKKTNRNNRRRPCRNDGSRRVKSISRCSYL